MLDFDLQNPTVSSLSSLDSGQLFLFDYAGKPTLAVALTKEDQRSYWMILTGDDAFHLMEHKRGRTLHVLPLNLNSEKIRLRIDHASCEFNYAEHRIGQLLITEEGAAIAAVWPGLVAKNYRNAIKLSDWSQIQAHEPRFMFNKWALSYVDQSGQWVDLFERIPPTQSE